MIAALILALVGVAESPPKPIVVASKPFGESYLLAEMFAQTLERRGFTVTRRPGLGSTEIAFGALRAGAIDVYPEYTGTGLLAILKERPQRDPHAVLAHVADAFAQRYDARWLPPLGFENTYAIAVRRETARRYHLQTLSDLARASPHLTAGFTPDFVGRPDGLEGLRKEYGFRFRDVRSLLQAVKYQALAASAVDVIDGYSTDGLIARYDLVVLRDDHRFFPPYEAAALVRGALYRERPDVILALTELSGRIDETRMRRWNQRVEVDGADVAVVARAALREIGVAGSSVRVPAGPSTDGGSLGQYFVDRRVLLARLTLRHLLLVGVSLLLALLIAVPLGLLLERARGRAEAVIRVFAILQTIPSIALLAFMIPLLGVGVVPALAALFLYTIYPILRNTYTGVRTAAPDAVDAGHALGMTGHQILWHVRMPLAAPVIMAGVRTAAVIGVGTATLAAFIGAGGLGDPIVSGLALADTRMILFGAIPAALLAIAIDVALAAVEHFVTPEPLRATGRSR